MFNGDEFAFRTTAHICICLGAFYMLKQKEYAMYVNKTVTFESDIYCLKATNKTFHYNMIYFKVLHFDLENKATRKKPALYTHFISNKTKFPLSYPIM